MVLTSLVAIVSSDFTEEIEGSLSLISGRSEQHYQKIGSLYLSISTKNFHLDLSNDSGFYDSEGCCIFLGNLYNFDEVFTIYQRREIQRDVNSNSELIYKLFRVYGPICFQFLNGRFSALIVFKNELFLVSDHASTIPLYYKVDRKSNKLYVITEIKSLLQLEKNPGFIINSCNSSLSSSFSPFKGIKRVPSGRYVHCKSVFNSLEEIKFHEYIYWNLPSITAIRSDEESIQLVRESLETSVNMCLSLCKSQTPGVILSGGVDSSIITRLVSKQFTNVNTFSVGMRDCNEFEFAQNVADYCSTRHHEFVITEDEILKALPEVIWAIEVNSSEIIEYVLALRILYSKVHNLSNFILTGYGSDMVFAGNLSPTIEPTPLHYGCISEFNSSDGCNEFSPELGTPLGIWTEHPFWTRYVLDSVMTIDPYLKNMNGIPKFVLRQAFKDDLPSMNVWREKIGNQQSTGIQPFLNSIFAIGETEPRAILAKKDSLVCKVLELLYCEGASPSDIDVCSL